MNTQTLPLLTNLMNWDKMFQSPFKSDVYFYSTRLQTDQRFGTPQPITIRDKDFGGVRLRVFGKAGIVQPYLEWPHDLATRPFQDRLVHLLLLW